ncbi:hypothetical protein POPTR_009G129800v4 [Populus trichocarpa]|uniref:Uncharacterized protein n=1 Tax=Populus trichocarpa TaxID=3694 RepID=A0ACC0SHZ8_POPTR|nr:hypothetical protein BDE02_09G114500 [Populus trichocarpa]KAI9388869.1 hypothetical protein POPTR_009G129800v4 [Populus trichocarpa]
MENLRFFFFALLLLVSPLLQGNLTFSSSQFLDPEPHTHAKLLLVFLWSVCEFTLFFHFICLKWNSHAA